MGRTKQLRQTPLFAGAWLTFGYLSRFGERPKDPEWRRYLSYSPEKCWASLPALIMLAVECAWVFHPVL
jgi:hypothetical protein